MRRLLLTLAIAAVGVMSVPMSADADDNAIAQYIMRKLKVQSRTQAALIAQRAQLSSILREA